MDVRLVITNPHSKVRQVRLQPQTLVGRSSECNLRIASGQVSRRHCLLTVGVSTVTIRDLGSVNGTQIDGETIPPQRDMVVEPGSKLTVGPLCFIVQYAAPKQDIDDRTDWLPRLPGSPKSSPEVGILDDVTLIVPQNSLSDDTSSWHPAARRRVDPPGDLDGPSDQPQMPAASSAEESEDNLNRSTEVGGELSESVLDADQESADSQSQSNDQLASQTHLEFEEDDLKQMEIDPHAAPFGEAEPAPDDSGIDDDLKKFLSGQ